MPYERQTSRDIKRQNRYHLLNRIYFSEPISRLELARQSGLSPATVTNIVGGLLAEDIVVEAGVKVSRGGRPRTMLKINPQCGYFVGIDLGETHVHAALYDVKLNSLEHVRQTLNPEEGQPEQVVRDLAACTSGLLRRAGLSEQRVIGVGIGVPGLVDRAGGVSVFAPNWGWQNVPLQTLFRSALPLPIQVDNGAQATALAEKWFGGGVGLDNLVVVLMGTGVGAGIITEGKLYHGATNSAGEWGHTSIEPHGRRCRCGSRGCIEAYAGAPGILAQYREAAPDGGALRAVPEAPQVAAILALQQAALARDPGALQVLRQVTQRLGVGMANLINLFNPQLIAVGGWCGLSIGPLILDDLRRVVAEYALRLPFSATAIQLTQLGADAVSLGAASLALQRFFIGEAAA